MKQLNFRENLNQIIYVSTLLLSFFMVIINYTGYHFINELIQLIWNLLFVILTILTNLSLRMITNKWMNRFYFLSVLLMFVFLFLILNVYPLMWMIVLLANVTTYKFKEHKIFKRVVMILILTFVIFTLSSILYVVSLFEPKIEVLYSTENTETHRSLVLELVDQGALGGNYNLKMQETIIDGILTKITYLQYLKELPKSIKWISKNKYALDDVLYVLD